MEFGRHAVLRGQFAFASTGSSPVGRTKYMPYVQAGEEAVLKTVGRKRLAVQILLCPPYIIYWDVAKPVRHRTLTPACSGSNPDVPAIFSGGVVSKLVKEMVCNTISAGSNPVNSSKILLL